MEKKETSGPPSENQGSLACQRDPPLCRTCGIAEADQRSVDFNRRSGLFGIMLYFVGVVAFFMIVASSWSPGTGVYWPCTPLSIGCGRNNNSSNATGGSNSTGALEDISPSLLLQIGQATALSLLLLMVVSLGCILFLLTVVFFLAQCRGCQVYQLHLTVGLIAAYSAAVFLYRLLMPDRWSGVPCSIVVDSFSVDCVLVMEILVFMCLGVCCVTWSGYLQVVVRRMTGRKENIEYDNL